MGNDKPEDKGLLPLPMVSSTKTGGATRTGGERIGPIGITTRTGGCVFEKEWQVFICFLNRFLFLTRQSKWKGVLLLRNPCVANQYFMSTSCLYLYTMLYDMLYHILYRTVITYVTQQVKQKIIQWYLALVWYYITYIIQCML